MRGTGWVMCAVMLGMLVPAFAQPADEAGKTLHGTWWAARAQRDGKGAHDVVGHRLAFAGDRFEVRAKDGTVLYEGTFRVEPSARPPSIDFYHTVGALKGKTWKGIYALDGDTLTICDNAPDLTRPRPVAFDATAASGYVLITFERGKP